MKNNQDFIIDREKEDKSIIEFQKTGNIKILEDVYQKRIPTIKNWAYNHYYPGLTCSVEDLFEDLSLVFVKAAEKYNKNRGSFNTCLYTFLLNRLKNIKGSNHAKKRTLANNNELSYNNTVSMDCPVANSDGSNSLTLEDVIPSLSEPAWSNMEVDNILDILSNKKPLRKKFLNDIAKGHSIVSTIRRYNTKTGTLPLVAKCGKKINPNKNQIKKYIKDAQKWSVDFKIINYQIVDRQLHYKVELEKTNDTEDLLKFLKHIRKNKDIYKQKIYNN